MDVSEAGVVKIGFFFMQGAPAAHFGDGFFDLALIGFPLGSIASVPANDALGDYVGPQPLVRQFGSDDNENPRLHFWP